MGTKASQADTGAEGLPEADDFKRIAGIGPVIERHLHEAGIRTFAQLAALTPEQIVGLVDHLPLLSAERIVRQDWAGRAHTLAGEAAALAAAAGGPAAPDQRYATFTVELLLDAQSQVVRTRAVHLQDGAEVAWEGWRLDRLVTFFGTYASALDAGEVAEHSAMNHPFAGQPVVSQDSLSDQAPPDPARAAEVLLELGELLVETVIVDNLGALVSRSVLQARLPFALAGPAARQLTAAGSPYSVAILASDTASGAVSLVGALEGRLRPEQQSYGPIVDLAPPSEGRFQLLGTVLIVQAGLMKSALGPVLLVV